MTTMPTIDDRMVYEFRRTGKRPNSYSMNRSRVVSQSSRVVQQATLTCYPYPLENCPKGAITICTDSSGNPHRIQC